MIIFDIKTIFFLKELWPYFKDIGSFAVALGAVWVAFQGLEVWKEQLRGKDEYDTARNFFKAALQLRDAISFVRNPAIPSGETEKAEEFYKRQNRRNEIKGDVAVYGLRWNRVIEASSVLQLASLEAELFWRDEIREIKKPLKDCVGKLSASVWRLLNPRLGYKEGMDDIIYESGDDEFTKDIEKAVQKIEDFVSKKIKFKSKI